MGKAFGTLVIDEGLPFLLKNWAGIWLTISVVGLISSIIFDCRYATIAGWTLSTVLSGMTAADLWGNILRMFGALFTGEYGEDVTTFSWSMLCIFLGSIIFFVNPTHIVSQSSRPVEAILFLAGVLLFCASVFFVFKNRILK